MLFPSRSQCDRSHSLLPSSLPGFHSPLPNVLSGCECHAESLLSLPLLSRFVDATHHAWCKGPQYLYEQARQGNSYCACCFIVKKNINHESGRGNEYTAKYRQSRLARAPCLDFTARQRKIVWQSATKFVRRCEKLSVLRLHLAGLCVELVSARRYGLTAKRAIYCVQGPCRMTFRQQPGHIHNISTKGWDGALAVLYANSRSSQN